MQISVVLSFYNEAQVLPEFLRRARSTLEQLKNDAVIDGYELIFVDDASTDGSLGFLRSEIPKGDVVIVEMARNVGVSECVLAGFALAHGDAVIYMDCDLQDPPELIRDLVDVWKESHELIDIVHTHRTTRKGESLLKRGITAFGYRLLERTSSVQLGREVGDFKLLSRRAVNIILSTKEQLPFTRGLVAQTRLRSLVIDYEREPRFDGAANTHFPVLAPRWIKAHLNRTLIAFSDFPLKALLVAGLSLGTVSFLYLIVVMIQKIMGWYEPGWPALMAGVVFFGATNLIGLGILGLYVNVIFLEVKQRSLYTIQNVYSATTIDLPKDAAWPEKIRS